jgi:hypothetical protein
VKETAMSDRPFEISRRGVGRMLLALPLAAAVAAEEETKRPAGAGGCIVSSVAGLSSEEEARLAKSIAEGEKPLAVIRDFQLPMDVPPSLRFAPLRSKRA